jgi:carbamoylphosphate synthase small subunit
MATQSDSNTEPPVAVAILHLEDGTSITGKSFGCHKAVEGEVCFHLLLGFNCIEK